MRRRNRQRFAQTSDGRKHRPDYALPVIAAAMMAIGLIVVFAISPGLSVQRDVPQNYFVSKQAVAILLGIIIFIITSKIPRSFWQKAVKPIVGLAVLASILAFLMPVTPEYPAHRWIRFAGFSLQAVEVVKFAVLLGLSYFLARQVQRNAMQSTDHTLKPLLILLGAVGVVVAVFQSDLGSAGVLVAMVGAMAFVAGLPLKRIGLFIGIIAIGTLLAISASPYRRDRLTTFLNPEQDCQNEGYQSCQALQAIGSGGLFGKGLDEGVAGYGYVPESANDSIFAVYGEMFGFVGIAVLLALYIGLFSRLKHIAERAPDEQSLFLVVGVLAWIGFQSIVNIGAMVGLLPLKGITLPFISYGGTSIIFVSAALGLVFQISRHTSFSIREPVERENNAHPAHRRGQRGTRHTPVSRRS